MSELDRRSPESGALDDSRVAPTTLDESGESGVDWAGLAVRVRRQLQHTLPDADPASLKDLTQEVLLRLLRALRRESVRNPQGLAGAIAECVRIDHIRSRMRFRRLEQTIQNHGDRAPEGRHRMDDACGDPLERARFVVREFFHHRQPCQEIYEHLSRGKTLSALSEDTGIRYDTVRKRWSLCLKALKREVRRLPDWNYLREWANE